MIALRNITVVALLALLLTVLPGGGNLTEAILTTLSVVFIAAIGLLIARFWRDNSLTRDVMSERDRRILYGSLAALMLMVAGIDELFDSGPGTVVWLAVVAASVYGLVTVWREASSY